MTHWHPHSTYCRLSKISFLMLDRRPINVDPSISSSYHVIRFLVGDPPSFSVPSQELCPRPHMIPPPSCWKTRNFSKSIFPSYFPYIPSYFLHIFYVFLHISSFFLHISSFFLHISSYFPHISSFFLRLWNYNHPPTCFETWKNSELSSFKEALGL